MLPGIDKTLQTGCKPRPAKNPVRQRTPSGKEPRPAEKPRPKHLLPGIDKTLRTGLQTPSGRKNDPRPISQIWAEDGIFTLNVGADTVYVGLRLVPGTLYAFVGDRETSLAIQKRADLGTSGKALATAAISEMLPFEHKVTLSQSRMGKKAARDNEVVFTLTSNNTTLSGRFLNANDEPVTGVSGKVFVTPANVKAAWHDTEINTEDGSYEIPLGEGIWNVSYRLDTDQYLPHPDGPIQVEASAEGATRNFTLTALDNVVKGQVLDPDGNPMANVQVLARKFRTDETGESVFASGVFTDSDGNFEISVPPSSTTSEKKGTSKGYDEYMACLYTAVDICGEDDEYCLTDAESACQQELFKRADGEITLTLRKADSYVEGKVFMTDGQTPVENAFVSAYSSDGQKTHGYTDSEGKYQLNAAMIEGSWKARASYKGTDDDTYYRSDFGSDVSSTEEVISMTDLTLKDAGELPSSETYDFLAEDGWMYSMSDGTQIQIPADGIRTEYNEVTIVIEPQVELPDSSQNRMLSYGYTMTLYEKDTGAEILDDFTEDINITFYYTDEQLTQLGITAANIRPAYFMTESNSWQILGSFTLDEDNKTISFQTEHLSDWTLVATTLEETYPDPGDIDNSKTIDLADVILVLQICTELPVSSNIYTSADVNENGKIGLEEAIYILRQLSKTGK